MGGPQRSHAQPSCHCRLLQPSCHCRFLHPPGTQRPVRMPQRHVRTLGPRRPPKASLGPSKGISPFSSPKPSPHQAPSPRLRTSLRLPQGCPALPKHVKPPNLKASQTQNAPSDRSLPWPRLRLSRFLKACEGLERAIEGLPYH